MNKKTEKLCSACKYDACPIPVKPRAPYDELSHEVDGNEISVRVAKHVGKIKTEGSGWPDSSSAHPNVHAVCEDERGNKCRVGCAKVNVIPNKPAPSKLPDEESFVLRATRQIVGPDELRNSLEIELRTPRNYTPLPPEATALVCPEPEKVVEDASEGKVGGGSKKKKKKK